MKKTSLGESSKWRNENSAISNHPLPPHLHGGMPQPPHIRSSRIQLNYDEETISRLNKLYADVDYLLKIIESSPPETKITFAMILGIQVDLNEYPQEVHPMIRFTTPFLTENNIELINHALCCADPKTAINIYKSCPPEQALLALAIASFIKTRDEV